MTNLQQADKLLSEMTPAEKAQVLQWVANGRAVLTLNRKHFSWIAQPVLSTSRHHRLYF
jgi:hypothetical protein